VWLRRRHPGWYNKYNYILGGGLDGGTQTIVFILSFAVYGASGIERPFPNVSICLKSPSQFGININSSGGEIQPIPILIIASEPHCTDLPPSVLVFTSYINIELSIVHGNLFSGCRTKLFLNCQAPFVVKRSSERTALGGSTLNLL
jgi:hypothetical protein